MPTGNQTRSQPVRYRISTRSPSGWGCRTPFRRFDQSDKYANGPQRLGHLSRCTPVRRGNLPGLHHLSAVAARRCGCGAGSDRAQHAHVGRLGHAAPGWRHLSREAAADLLADRHHLQVFGVHDWAARIPIALSAIALVLADRGVWNLGVRQASRLLCRSMHGDVRRAVAVHARSDSRRHVHVHDRSGHVGVAASS